MSPLDTLVRMPRQFVIPLRHTLAVGLVQTYLTSLDLCQDKPQTGKKADVIKAAHLCAEAALRLVKPGNKVTLSLQDC